MARSLLKNVREIFIKRPSMAWRMMSSVNIIEESSVLPVPGFPHKKSPLRTSGNFETISYATFFALEANFELASKELKKNATDIFCQCHNVSKLL